MAAARDYAGRAGRATVSATRWSARFVRGEVVKRVGGPARARVIVLFAAVLALSGADTATIGAVAPQLEHALHIGNTKIGLLSSVSLLVGAVFTLPVGLLVDRFKRMPMLALSIVLWSIASLPSAFASSYSGLLLTRVLLGAVIATAGPAIASLTGDYFPARERGRVYAYILGGEIAGTAVGFIVSGSIASLISWRAAFLLLSLPGFFLARELYRTVPEPLRGGQSRLEPGVVDLHEAAAAARAEGAAGRRRAESEPTQDDDYVQEAVRKLGVSPDPKLVLTTDPRELGLVDARALHPLDPDQHPDDHQLVAGLLLLLRAVDLRAAVRARSLPREPGDRRARAGAARRRRDDRDARQRAADRRDAAPRLPARCASGSRRSATSARRRCCCRASSAASLTPASGSTSPEPRCCRPPTRRSTRPSSTSCRPDCGVAPRARARCCARSRRRSRRSYSADWLI